MADVHSLDLRLYLANPAGFSEIFSTQRFANHPSRIPKNVEAYLRSTKQPS